MSTGAVIVIPTCGGTTFVTVSRSLPGSSASSLARSVRESVAADSMSLTGSSASSLAHSGDGSFAGSRPLDSHTGLPFVFSHLAFHVSHTVMARFRSLTKLDIAMASIDTRVVGRSLPSRTRSRSRGANHSQSMMTMLSRGYSGECCSAMRSPSQTSGVYSTKLCLFRCVLRSGLSPPQINKHSHASRSSPRVGQFPPQTSCHQACDLQ